MAGFDHDLHLSNLTVAVVTWNRQEELDALLLSLRSNPLLPENLPIVVLDNGSTPPYRHSEQDAFLEIHRSEINLGCAGGRNFLSSLIQTEFVLFLDDDGLLGEHSFKFDLLSYFRRDSSLACISGLVREKHHENTVYRHPWRIQPRNLCDAGFRSAPGIMGGCVIFRNEIFRECGMYPERSKYGGEEVVLAANMVARGWKLGFSNHLVLEHDPSDHGRLDKSEWAYEALKNRLWLASTMFSFPMKFTLWLSSLASIVVRLRFRVSLHKIIRVHREVRRERISGLASNVPRIKFWNLRVLRKLGLRAWL